MPERRILLSGFEPFGGEPLNPASEVLSLLEGKYLGGCLVVTQLLPTVRECSLFVLTQAIKRENPSLVIALGQAEGRFGITPERVAINIDDFRIPDNEGNQPCDLPISPGAPVAYWSTLPIKAMVKGMLDAGIPASVSNSAGTFVCNHVFFGLMHLLAQEGNIRKGGFIHIPYLMEQAARIGNQPSMSRASLSAGLEIALTVAATMSEDIRSLGGALN